MILRLGGFPAELARIDLPEGTRGHRALSIYRVADLERQVSREELLRGTGVHEPPYWALVWTGARAIAARLLDCPPAPMTAVLDLGCGLGLSGIAAGMAGCRVLFADIAPPALAFAAANADLHRLRRFRTQQLDFTRARLEDRFDLILASDIVYDPDQYARLVDFLDRHLTPSGSILLTESLRADARNAIAALAQRGFVTATQAIWVEEEGRPERSWLHTLRRASSDGATRVDHSSGRN